MLGLIGEQGKRLWVISLTGSNLHVQECSVIDMRPVRSFSKSHDNENKSSLSKNTAMTSTGQLGELQVQVFMISSSLFLRLSVVHRSFRYGQRSNGMTSIVHFIYCFLLC
jgi:hypothetical protein